MRRTFLSLEIPRLCDQPAKQCGFIYKTARNDVQCRMRLMPGFTVTISSYSTGV